MEEIKTLSGGFLAWASMAIDHPLTKVILFLLGTFVLLVGVWQKIEWIKKRIK